MHLMMHDRATGAERLYKFMTPAQKSLAVARNAVSRNAKNAKALLDEVDPSMQNNPLYYFSRAQRARQFELWDDSIAYLNKGKATDPDSAEWWYERQTLTRQLLSLGDPKRAYLAAAGYTDGPEGRVVEAQFHSGWIALSFLDDPKAAAPHFARQAELSTLPDTVTQANYWLGRALSKAGEADKAKAAFEVAAAYPTVYYGLLARQELGLKPVELRTMPEWKDSEAAFNENEVVQAINLLVADGEKEMAGALLKTLAAQLKTGGELVLAAKLAQTIDAHNLAIAIADIADKRGMPLDMFSFPKDGLPANKVAAADTAAIYAIARQESRFQVNAVSSSGARGLMQLMPGTARETANKIGLAYSASKLTSDPLYNAQLGASYLDDQLAKYDGSLLLAAAAYNAGPGNANKWLSAFGDPRSSKVDPVVWVELIPFQETRKYVQRVFGNYMVYRARLGYDDPDVSKVMHSING
jgi:soluble lytic murein transglycosylase